MWGIKKRLGENSPIKRRLSAGSAPHPGRDWLPRSPVETKGIFLRRTDGAIVASAPGKLLKSTNREPAGRNQEDE